jgi:hypothetical protein
MCDRQYVNDRMFEVKIFDVQPGQLTESHASSKLE